MYKSKEEVSRLLEEKYGDGSNEAIVVVGCDEVSNYQRPALEEIIKLIHQIRQDDREALIDKIERTWIINGTKDIADVVQTSTALGIISYLKSL